MKTKILKTFLLLAVAVLPMAVLAVGARPAGAGVYSQNIVGYVNKTLPGSNAYSQISAPFVPGNNTVEAIMPALQKGDKISLWTGSQFLALTYAGTNFDGQGHAWMDHQGHGRKSPLLHPGQAFFYQNNGAAPVTNTFVGSVLPSGDTTIPGGHAYTMLASAVAKVAPLDSPDLALPLQPGDRIMIFIGDHYHSFTFKGANFDGHGHAFADAAGHGQPAPVLQVGQGFFYQNNQDTAEIWHQTSKLY